MPRVMLPGTVFTHRSPGRTPTCLPPPAQAYSDTPRGAHGAEARQAIAAPPSVGAPGGRCARTAISARRNTTQPLDHGALHAQRVAVRVGLDRGDERGPDLVRVRVEVMSLDSTRIKVHPDGTGALEQTVPKPSGSHAGVGAPGFIGLPRMLEAPSGSRSPGEKRVTGHKDVPCRSP